MQIPKFVMRLHKIPRTRHAAGDRRHITYKLPRTRKQLLLLPKSNVSPCAHLFKDKNYKKSEELWHKARILPDAKSPAVRNIKYPTRRKPVQRKAGEAPPKSFANAAATARQRRSCRSSWGFLRSSSSYSSIFPIFPARSAKPWGNSSREYSRVGRTPSRLSHLLSRSDGARMPKRGRTALALPADSGSSPFLRCSCTFSPAANTY